jgi:5-methylcytosine-specific restriction endonuclease McrA
MSINRLVLVLNASYEPVTICTARRAITLVMKGAAVVEEVSVFTLRTPRIHVPVPSVVRLRTYRRVPRVKRSVSRKGIILRDASSCQYCGRRFEPRELTLDHVIPRSRGGQSSWDNLVAACLRCNNRKGNRTPEESGMQLVRAPRPIGIHAKHRLLAGDDRVWDKYLFV